MDFDEKELSLSRRDFDMDLRKYLKETLNFASTLGLGAHYLYGYDAAIKYYDKPNKKIENNEQPSMSVIIPGSIFGLGLFGTCIFGYYKAFETGRYEYLSIPIVSNLLSYLGTSAYHEIKRAMKKENNK